MFTTALGFLISVVIFQGIIDFFVWKVPFAELIAYVEYNLGHAYEYHTMLGTTISPYYLAYSFLQLV